MVGSLQDACMKENPLEQMTLHNTELHSAVRLRPPNPSRRRSEMLCDMEIKTTEMEKKIYILTPNLSAQNKF